MDGLFLNRMLFDPPATQGTSGQGSLGIIRKKLAHAEIVSLKKLENNAEILLIFQR
jgi:hypothetical protein